MNSKTRETEAIDQSGETRRELRYELWDSPDVDIATATGDVRKGANRYRGRLFDLSKSGARVLCMHAIEPDASIGLLLTIQQLGLKINIAGNVCWSRPISDDAWVFGCSFDPELPDEVFDTLATGSEIERRSALRSRHRIEVGAFWDLDGDTIPVMLQDYSQGGFCVRTCQPATGRRLFHLRLVDPCETMIVARFVWQLKAEDGYLVGCSFLNGRDAGRLANAVSTRAARPIEAAE